MAIYPRIDAGRKNIGFPLGVPSCPPRLYAEIACLVSKFPYGAKEGGEKVGGGRGAGGGGGGGGGGGKNQGYTEVSTCYYKSLLYRKEHGTITTSVSGVHGFLQYTTNDDYSRDKES
ncbi:hypothetical protein V1477_016406 [Vespula maculifrons]|uniref:Uncharacterized protein n=1 Tax=Vespula maculifrons TaxID=7453 RepID=A0ABD2BCZ7_VESMC